jgi:TonB-dependent SusC/RagA subfamily outer membrane receptor
MKNIPFSGDLNDVLKGLLHGVIITPAGVPYLQMNYILLGGGRPMLIIVDGLQLSRGTSLLHIGNANDVETVEVLKYASTSIYGMEGGGGVLIITTKQGSGLATEDIESKGVFSVVIKGFYKAREFYSPKYDVDAAKKPNADLRTTIFWKPNLITNKDGNASFDFHNADGRGNYRVVVEGFDDKGNLGRQVYRYKVN